MFIIWGFDLLDLAAEKIFEKASSYYYFLPVCLNLGECSNGFSSAYDIESSFFLLVPWDVSFGSEFHPTAKNVSSISMQALAVVSGFIKFSTLFAILIGNTMKPASPQSLL